MIPTCTSGRISAGEYRYVCSDGTVWLAAKISGRSGWRLFSPSDGRQRAEFHDANGGEWMWWADFDDRGDIAAWLRS